MVKAGSERVRLGAIAHVTGDHVAGRGWEFRLVDAEGRILATLAADVVWELRYVDDHDPDGFTAGVRAVAVPSLPAPSEAAAP